MSKSGDLPALADRAYQLAVGDEDARLCRDIPDEQCDDQPANFVWHVLANALSKIGDALADAKVILPWLIGAVGGPTYLIGLLVPIRESLALLPQMLVGGIIRRYPVRKYFWVASSAVEGCCVLGMAAVGVFGLQGALAGWLIVGLLVVFSAARGVASIASKDTLGKTVSKGKRGRVTGYAATVSGMVAAVSGLYLALSPEAARPAWVLYLLVASAGVSWLLAAAMFAQIREYAGATDGSSSLGEVLRGQLDTLLSDAELRRFILARALMMSTALSAPVYVALAQRETGGALAGLGWLVLASGLASALSSAVWGGLADRSSRLTMIVASGLGGLVALIVLTLLLSGSPMSGHISLFAGALFILSIAHAGVRIGRKTHIVDLAGGDNKSAYVALSNTVIGIALLIVGGFLGALVGWSPEIALGVLAAMAFAGATLTATMREVQ